MTKFTLVELFAGVGGISFGLEAVGGECLMAAEYDPQMKTQFAQQTYKILHPAVDVRGDIHGVGEKDVPDHDVLTLTPPCQSFSVAGKRLGFEDTRGTLVFEALRIAKYKQPKILLMENVKGLVGHDKGRTLDTIIHSINEIGYTVDFQVLNSKYFGVPQNRERIFIVAVRDDLLSPEPWTIEGNTVVPKGKRRISGYEGVKTFNFDWPEQTDVTTRLRDVLETDVGEKYYLSDDKTDALVAQLEDGLAIREATKQGYAMAAVGDAVNFQFPDSKTRRGRVGKQIANTLEASSINQGVVEAKEIASGDNISYCIDANYAKGISPSSVNKGRRTQIEETAPKYRIRKLTPLETWRLQGFSDEAHQTVVDAGLSDSQRYKQAGNAVTVNVITAIGERLLRYL